MQDTVCIPRSEYQEFVKYRHIVESKKSKFNFDKVFGLGTGKLNAQEVKDMLREEW